MDANVQIFDFAYPEDDPRHYGVYSAVEHSDTAVSSKNSINSFIEEETLGLKTSSESEAHKQAKQDSATEELPETLLLGKAVALFDFEGEGDEELSFKKGEQLILTKRQTSGWVVGYKGDEVGLVPEAYVKIIGEPLQ
ncbi:hypothetical protein BB561_003025 [Smittium simulii]|uniref:SH3 domain-containing protein n=1 Tax=Smittium simulii TaxID=133385 RepID=A0A2T9YN99_9FUNG|nr:hypothetical protein BB561_003025 [Smittium simulii]